MLAITDRGIYLFILVELGQQVKTIISPHNLFGAVLVHKTGVGMRRALDTGSLLPIIFPPNSR